jgi:hypothetical protein
MNQHLVQYARQLRLSGLLASLNYGCGSPHSSTSHEQFLELIPGRTQRAQQRRSKSANGSPGSTTTKP